MKPRIKFGRNHFELPRSAVVRIIIGLSLIIGGLLGFLPVLGFWMIPLGILVLSVDLPVARRWRRRFVVWWERRWRGDKGSRGANGPPPGQNDRNA